MKKILAGMIAPCIAIGTFGTPAMAATKLVASPISSTVSDSSEGLKNAIINVKSKIDIPEELTEFSYNYVSNNYSRNPYWNLIWRDKDYELSIRVNCDDKGNISYYNFYNSNLEKVGPKFLKEELLENAKAEIKKLAPSIAEHMVFEKAVFNGMYSSSYTYNFTRVENGIKMPDNTVSVTLRYDTGDIISFSCNWEYDVKIPSSEILVTEEDAKAKIGENVDMSLQYRNKVEEVDGKNVVKAYLVYIPDKYYVAIDAKTGEIYDTHDEYFSMDDYQDTDALESENKSMMSDSTKFTEAEIEKIEEIKGLISKEDAVKIITSEKSFLISGDAKAVDASLCLKYGRYDEDKSEYVWRINLFDPRKVDYDKGDTYRANISATVDAKTGKILYFRASTPGYYDKDSKEWKDINVKYSNDECKKVLEAFIKKTEPEKFKDTKLSNDLECGYVLKIVNDKNVYGGYSYTYNRYNEGIEYSYNNIYGAVDGVTGKIYAYSTNWTDDIVFESPKGAMTAKDAINAYLNTDGFELVYEINNKHYIDDNRDADEYYDYSELYLLEKEARLVYRTNVNPAIISPFTGKQLNYNGDVYEDEDEKEYNDIEGFWAERDIKLITDLNVNFEGESFMPNKEITEKELNDMLQKLGYYGYKEESEKDSLTKIETIKIIIDKLGLTKVAELKDIYKVEFSDLATINKDDMGYIALAKALNIIGGDEIGNINPNKNVTRAEAVTMAIKLINCGIDR